MTHTILYYFDLVSNEIYSITHKWGTHLDPNKQNPIIQCSGKPFDLHFGLICFPLTINLLRPVSRIWWN